MLNNNFSSVFNIISVGDSIKMNDINTNDATSRALVVGRQDTTAELCDNTSVDVSNNENHYVLIYTVKS